MKIIRDLEAKYTFNTTLAMALGNFDGVHRGHQRLISQCVLEAQKNGRDSCVLTFEPHPNLILAKGRNFKLLNNYEQKYRLLENLGVDYLFLLSFNSDLAGLKPEQFVRRYFIELAPVKDVFIGYNFTFGYKGLGTADTLQQLGQQNGFAVNVLKPVIYANKIVSSSLIREKYRQGEIAESKALLGHPPLLEGRVIAGEQRGRIMGFPTANLEVPDYLLLPAYGVYAAYAVIRNHPYKAVVNIGLRPTFAGNNPTVEAYILDYKENLYEENLSLQLVHRIRPEIKFPGLEQLKEQIALDVKEARLILQEEKFSG